MPGGGHSKHRRSRTRLKFTDLPVDIIRRIFAKVDSTGELCKLMEVCKKFETAAKWPELWKHVKVTDPHTKVVGDHEPEEERIIDPITLRAVTKTSQHAYRFITYGLFQGDNNVTVNDSSNGAPSRKKKGVGFAVDVITSRAGSNLEHLDLLRCYPNFPRFDHQMTDDDLKLITSRCSESLQTLRLSPSLFLTGPTLIEMATACKRLRTLHVINCSCMNDILLGEIARACPKLEDISVKRCSGFRGEGLHARLIPVHETLRRLDVSQTETTSLNLLTLLRYYSSLEEIDASWCFELTLRNSTVKEDELKCRTLTKLNLRNADTDVRVMRRVVGESPNLRELHLSTNVRDRRQMRVLKMFSIGWPRLEALTLARVTMMNDVWEQIIENLCQSLVRLDVSDNRYLTCEMDVKEGQSLGKLEELNISGTATTERALKQIVLLAPRLKCVKMQGCLKISRKVRMDPYALRDLPDSVEDEDDGSAVKETD